MNTFLTRLLITTGMSLVQTTMAAGFGNDNRGCAADRPCFSENYQSGNSVIFKFGGGGWDFYNVRFAQIGGGEKQVENRSGTFTLKNTKPHSTYILKVQGCNSHALRSSTCSPWVDGSVNTK